MRLALATALLLATAALAGCALFRPPLTPQERLARDAQRLAEAPNDVARTLVAVELLRAAGLTPIADRSAASSGALDGRFAYGAGPVVAGFVPGRTPGLRDTLVILAAAIDGPFAADMAAAGRMLVDAAAVRGSDPGRSILVALWGPDVTPAQGAADAAAFPLWPRRAVRQLLVVTPDPGAVPAQMVGGLSVLAFAPGGERVAGFATATDIATRALAAASTPSTLTRADSTLTIR